MNRRDLLQGTASAALIAFLPTSALAKNAGVPWARLRRALDGELIELHSPFQQCLAQGSRACDTLFSNIKNPYYIGDNPALTQTVGWADAWTSAASTYAVAAQHAGDIAQAVNFARENGLRIVVKGGGHSYQGTSNAPDSLLVWTRHMHDIHIDGNIVKIGAGAMWGQVYEAVTTRAGRYVQGGGCANVGVAGLVQSGGFGSFSKRFGTAAGSLLEAEVITADGNIRTVNASNDPELFWALKGGGGGTFGIVSNVTLALHDLPDYAGAAETNIKASSDAAYRELIDRFMSFYHESLLNEHFGESVSFGPDNTLKVSMVSCGLSRSQMADIWKPFFDAIKSSPSKYSFNDEPYTGATEARHWWDYQWRLSRGSGSVRMDPRPGHATNWWWSGDSDQVGVFLYGYESLWLPQSLLEDDARSQLVDALFRASRNFGFALHFNKGLAGAPADAINAARDTAMNPKALTAFALAICADGAQGLYPGIPGHEPDMKKARDSARAIHRCVDELRRVAPDGGSYVSESNYFEQSYTTSYWGTNYPRLLAVKRRYDPNNFFRVHNGVMA